MGLRMLCATCREKLIRHHLSDGTPDPGATCSECVEALNAEIARLRRELTEAQRAATKAHVDHDMFNANERLLIRAEKAEARNRNESILWKQTHERAEKAEATVKRLGMDCACGEHHWVCSPCVLEPMEKRVVRAERERDDANLQIGIWADDAVREKANHESQVATLTRALEDETEIVEKLMDMDPSTRDWVATQRGEGGGVDE